MVTRSADLDDVIPGQRFAAAAAANAMPALMQPHPRVAVKTHLDVARGAGASLVGMLSPHPSERPCAG